MHVDTVSDELDSDWEAYLSRLHASGRFRGGSSIGSGQAFRKMGIVGPVAAHISGFLRLEASDMDDACGFLEGNPTFEAGGTVEIREVLTS